MKSEKIRKLVSKLTPFSTNFLFRITYNKIYQKEITIPYNCEYVFSRGNRDSYFDYLSSKFNEPICFMEFGVYEGYSINYFASKNIHEESIFFGFDSFTGLPESWGEKNKGHFDKKGKPPEITDKRIHYVVGLFQETLENFLEDFKIHNKRLVIHIDSDLYSSALFCLSQLDRFIKKDTIIMFDQFAVSDEFRAFYDYVTSHYRKYSFCARQQDWAKVAIIIK